MFEDARCLAPVIDQWYNTDTMNSNSAITFDHVSKRFVLQHERARSFQDLLLSVLHRRNGSREAFWALKDATLSVQRGEMLGLIGPNGAGKSTILKLMTRILEPTSGTIKVQGRVAALLELGTGFHPDLTGRENVFLNGSLLGFGRRQMEQRLDSIIDFAGMERFIDMPVRHYSSGMYMRLGFAIAVHLDPDVLITDEVLAVGDEAFQQKCLERMRKFRDEGVTIILVSHALPVVRTLCDRVIWLQQGQIVMDGGPDEVIDAYVAEVAAQKAGEHGAGAFAHPHQMTSVISGLADIRLLNVEMIDPDGKPGWEIAGGARTTLRFHYQVRKDFPAAALAVQVRDAVDHSVICDYNSYSEQMPLHLHEGSGAIDLSVPLPLREGHYLLTVALFGRPDPPAWTNPDDLHQEAYSFHVRSALTAPRRRWGTGQALLTDVRLCDANGAVRADFVTGAPMSVHLRCMKTGEDVIDPVLRIQIFDCNGVLCHATNTDRNGAKLGELASPREVTLAYDHLDLLEGSYVLSVGLTPAENARHPYDWHDKAYRFRVSSEDSHGAGLVALSHQWVFDD